MGSTPQGDPQNPMNPNTYTEKAFDSIAKLPQYADKYSTQYVEAPLVLRSIIDEKGGLGQRILEKASLDPSSIVSRLDDHLNKQPKVSGVGADQKSFARSAMDLLAKSQSFKTEYGDSFVSVEHLILAAADTDGYSKQVFKEAG